MIALLIAALTLRSSGSEMKLLASIRGVDIVGVTDTVKVLDAYIWRVNKKGKEEVRAVIG